MLSLINLQLKKSICKVMKKIVIRSLLAAVMASALIISCEPMEPSTYTEDFHRFATVQYKNNKASLLIDYSGETYYCSNFVTKADMEKFEVQPGDRVLASMTINAIGNIFNNDIILNKVYKYPTYKVAESKPSDSIYNYKYELINYVLNQNSGYTYIKYPLAWSQGHLVNMMATYNISKESVEGEFYLYPIEVVNRALVMTLYSNIPDTLPASYMRYSFLCYDLSSLRDSVNDSIEQAHRDTILSQLERLHLDSILVEIHEPEIMRNYYKIGDQVSEREYYNPRSYTTVSVPFDF